MLDRSIGCQTTVLAPCFRFNTLGDVTIADLRDELGLYAGGRLPASMRHRDGRRVDAARRVNCVALLNPQPLIVC